MPKKTMKVRFINKESPGLHIEFTFQGKRYSLQDGMEYKLPIDVIEHLNSLSYPDSAWEIDEATGQARHIKKGRIQRFVCVPLDLTAEYDALEKARKKAEGAEATPGP